MSRSRIAHPASNLSLSRLVVYGLLSATLALGGCSTLIGATTEDSIQLDPGKRTLGAFIDDEQIETIAQVNLDKASPALKQSHINVTSFNGVALITGQVANSDLRQLAGSTVSAIKNVRQVHNELQIQGKTSLLARTNDTWLTTKVKSRLLGNKDVDSGRIKVVTEYGVVYLMGLMSRIEADQAAEVARTTGGVQKVVKAFEYID